MTAAMIANRQREIERLLALRCTSKEAAAACRRFSSGCRNLYESPKQPRGYFFGGAFC